MNVKLFGKPIMKNKNNKGPEIGPCETSESIRQLSEILSLSDTFCSLLDKYDLNQLEAKPLTPYEDSFLRRILRSTQNQLLIAKFKKS